MIADFRYTRLCHDDDVVVSMYWDQSSPMADVRFPDGWGADWQPPGVPPGHELPLISALAYALFVAGKAGRNLRLTGDRTVWPHQWGELKDDSRLS